MRKVVLVIVLLLLLGAGYVGTKKFVAYAHAYTGTTFNEASLEGSEPRFFYLDWRGDLSPEAVTGLLDAQGLLDFGDAVSFRGRTHRDPLRVIQACLGLHDQLLTSPDPELETLLRRQVDWLLDEAMLELPGEIPVWPQYYRFDRYGLTAPWISALTQGQAISLLVRMAVLTGEERYAEHAFQATLAFMTEGCPIVWRGEDGLFFEEYPCDPPSHVLNGCLFAWLGLWDWARYRDDHGYRQYCLDCLEQIERRVPDFELGDWTRYDVLQERPTSPTYQEIHAALAEALAAITERPFWADRAHRWRAAADNGLGRSRVFIEVLVNRASEKILGRPQPDGRGLKNVRLLQTQASRPILPDDRAHTQPGRRREIA